MPASHHWATCFFPTSRVHDSTLHRQRTPQASPFPHFPGYSPPPYGSWAPSHAELFLRSRECAGFPEKKEMWSAELSEEKIIKEKPRLHRNRSFFLYIFSSFLHEASVFLLRKKVPLSPPQKFVLQGEDAKDLSARSIRFSSSQKFVLQGRGAKDTTQ